LPLVPHLFPVERHRIVNLMIERIDLVHVGEVQGIKVKCRELGWDQLQRNPLPVDWEAQRQIVKRFEEDA